MYNAIWEKYLSVIRILLKRALNEEQSLKFNSYDFEKIGPQKKTGFNFTLKFTNGRVDNLAGLSAVAKELSAVLLANAQVKELLQQGEYQLTMNAKFVLGIKLISPAAKENELVSMEAAQ